MRPVAEGPEAEGDGAKRRPVSRVVAVIPALDEAAIILYRAFLRALSARFAEASFDCGWYVTPPDAWEEISPLVDWGGREMKILLQGEGDLGERQRELSRGATAPFTEGLQQRSELLAAAPAPP